MEPRTTPLVTVIMGSESDRQYMEGTIEVLEQLGVATQTIVMSAHRNPERVREFALGASRQGIEVIIAGAGAAAHLPGALASWCTLPIIGVPLPTSDLRGVDSLLAIVQMPAGVPVATVGVGKAGAKNAAYLAAQMLGLKHEAVRQAYERHRKKIAGG